MRRIVGAIVLGAAVALVTAGCGGQKSSLLLPNQPPEVELFAQRMSGSAIGPSAYRLKWVGRDPDGRIDHYLYALGSPAADPRAVAWTSTTLREHALSFPARRAAPGRASIDATEPSVFSVRAVDGRGATSTPARIAFFDGTLGPIVRMVSPPANRLINYSLPPTVCVQWTGTAFDSGGTEERISEYKYKVLTDQTEVTAQTARVFPDSVRRYYAPRNWEGWMTVDGRVTSAVLQHLADNSFGYVFVITGFDDEGNYDPLFSFDTNMIFFRVTSSPLLPRITAFNQFFFYTQAQGSFDPSHVVNLEVPAGQPITFNWFAEPPRDHNGNVTGGPIRGYRWGLDLTDVNDPRHGDDAGHSGHWTRWSLTNTSATVGPFQGGETHSLYIEANADRCGEDSASVGLLSLRLHAVQPSFDKELLIVDDTRFVVDRINPGTNCNHPTNAPLGAWPTAAELDTFLYARGGAPWRCYPPGTMSTPGIFSGYAFDTLGTRRRNDDLTVPLSTFAHYRNVIWLVDGQGARNDGQGTDPARPQTAMRYMNDARKENTLAAYVRQGGRVWLAGAGAATASMINFDKTANNLTPPEPRALTFRNSDGELIPGRFVYDQVHWRSEFKQYQVNSGRIRRYLGRFESSPGLYASLPQEIQLKTLATDPFPPNRTGQSLSVFYQTLFYAEFLSAANEILENADPRPHHEDFEPALDTLYKVTGPALQPDTGPGALQSVVMTYYHGAENAPLVMTGFSLWSFRRSELVQLVDFVLQELWGMTRATPVSASAVMAPGEIRQPVGGHRPPRVTPDATTPGRARRN